MENQIRSLITVIKEAELGREKLTQNKLPVKKADLEPILSEETINYHFGKLAKGYVDTTVTKVTLILTKQVQSFTTYILGNLLLRETINHLGLLKILLTNILIVLINLKMNLKKQQCLFKAVVGYIFRTAENLRQ